MKSFSNPTARTRVTVVLGVALTSVLILAGCGSVETQGRLAAKGVPSTGSPTGEPWVVSLGDSFISGEAGRWAGNESFTTADVDALGSSAYFDGAGRESINRCHRSASAGIHIGDTPSLNLACSGAITSTKVDEAGNFKPGIDFSNEGGRKGQALMLKEFAKDHRVAMVALSIGGNDFNFSPIIAECIKSFLKPSIFGSYCSKDSKVQSYVSSKAADRVRGDTTQAILRIADAMEQAGYEDANWTLVLQQYPNPLPRAGAIRYTESGYDRQLIGGCGFRDQDANWASDTLLPLVNTTFVEAAQQASAERPTLRIARMDASRAFDLRALCDADVERVGSKNGVDSWQAVDAADRSEWVMEINMVNPNDTFQQESLHPNYWGQLALRNCWRQVWNDGDVRGGACARGAGLNELGEPQMSLEGNSNDYWIGEAAR